MTKGVTRMLRMSADQTDLSMRESKLLSLRREEL
jgi:hypothetical protein